MELKHLLSHQSLITEISDELVTFVEILDIPADINKEDDHAFISDIEGDLALDSFYQRQNTDVVLPAEVFCELLMDIKAGMTVIDAFNRRGYTF